VPRDSEPEQQRALASFFQKGAYTFIPIPAFSYARNEGYWIGALVPTLKEDQKGELSTIIAPQYLFNPLVGHTGTLNVFRYPSDTAQYELTASLSERIAQDIDVRYKDVGAGGGRYIVGAQANWFKNPFERFFGFGNRAPDLRETNYTSQEGLVKLMAGINCNPDLALTLTERYRDVRIQQGIINSLPQTKDVFGRVAGIEGAQIIGHRLALVYDTRDHQRTPTKGTYVTLSGEFNQNLSHEEENQWVRYTLDARTLLPHGDGRYIFVPHLLLDGVVGNQLQSLPSGTSERRGIPFYERPMLGGEHTLRAFGQNRFISNTAMLVNLEERVLLKEVQIMGYALDLQVAPFLDVGRVQQQSLGDKFNLRHWQVNPGVGLRVLAKPHIVGWADFAVGRDGFNAFVGIDYPF
jgi:outer membrane protein assembly factor BamA